MNHPLARLAIATVLLCALPLALAPVASAHEARNVGAYHFLVGWGTEPAYAGQENSVQLVLSKRATGKPVTTLGNSLKVAVMYGGRHMQFTLEPTWDPDTGFGTPGDYRAWLFPTTPGTYIFHFTGSIGSQKIDESFSSGPTTFSPVDDPASVQFPLQAPSNAELAARVAADSSRSATESQVTAARTLGIVGIIVGAIGLGLATFTLVRRRA
jgi:hypothetical protein